MLVTSRVPLDVPGEQVFVLAPLGLAAVRLRRGDPQPPVRPAALEAPFAFPAVVRSRLLVFCVRSLFVSRHLETRLFGEKECAGVAPDTFLLSQIRYARRRRPVAIR